MALTMTLLVNETENKVKIFEIKKSNNLIYFDCDANKVI